jgi:hypothetical protein
MQAAAAIEYDTINSVHEGIRLAVGNGSKHRYGRRCRHRIFDS